MDCSLRHAAAALVVLLAATLPAACGGSRDAATASPTAAAGAPAGGATTAAGATAAASPQRVAGRPRIVWRPIPFPRRRLRETAAYSRRHYGRRRWRLRHPHVIVEHYTANQSFSATWNTFASDTPDPELQELPGTCAHFVIDRDGTIYQLVHVRIRCRHTVGLNWTAIGIEHVGTSDAEVVANRAQRRASLRLTLWLMSRYRIGIHGVIGHAESLLSRYHRERYPAWRCQTHGDWTHADMRRYRRLLRLRARRLHVALRAGRPLRSRPPRGC
jgi:N-acetylmuramoyl-L-alanine amidase